MKSVAHGLAPPFIPAVVDEARPLWSVMVPTFNCAPQARQALASVIDQAPDARKMEIVVVDDASSDDIAAVVEGFNGRVRLHRQSTNLGVPANLTEAIRVSRGTLVHILHGDDLVDHGFYAAMELALADPRVGAAFCRAIYIDQEGREVDRTPLLQERAGAIEDAVSLLAQEQRVMTPSMCVRRAVYERLGGFHPALHCAEDWEMWVRIAKHYEVAYVPAGLARYRMHPDSNTGRNIREARDVEFNKLAIAINEGHLPQSVAATVTRKAQQTYALSALATATKLARAGDLVAARAQCRAALALRPNLRTLAGVTRASLGIAMAGLRERLS